MLKIDGKVFNPEALTDNEARLLAFLKKAPPDEVFTTANILSLTGLKQNIMKSPRALARKCFQDHTAIVGCSRYWGNPKAIQELLRAVGR